MDKADYCTVLLDRELFGRCRKESYGFVAAAAKVACGKAGWHRDVNVEEGGIGEGLEEGVSASRVMDKQTRKSTSSAGIQLARTW